MPVRSSDTAIRRLGLSASAVCASGHRTGCCAQAHRPELAWRGEFVTMTRRFETEWYGRAQSNIDALDDAAERARRILDTVRRRAAA